MEILGQTLTLEPMPDGFRAHVGKEAVYFREVEEQKLEPALKANSEWLFQRLRYAAARTEIMVADELFSSLAIYLSMSHLALEISNRRKVNSKGEFLPLNLDALMWKLSDLSGYTTLPFILEALKRKSKGQKVRFLAALLEEPEEKASLILDNLMRYMDR